MRAPSPKELRRLIGVPFISGGRDPAIGLDCWGLFMLVHRMYGHDVPDVAVTCTALLDINRTARRQIAALWLPADAPGPGVSVVMATDHAHPDIIQHFGVFIDRRRVIHCLQHTGVVADDWEIMQGALCVKGLYRWHGPTL